MYNAIQGIIMTGPQMWIEESWESIHKNSNKIPCTTIEMVFLKVEMEMESTLVGNVWML
jgi:hypothetical protein